VEVVAIELDGGSHLGEQPDVAVLLEEQVSVPGIPVAVEVPCPDPHVAPWYDPPSLPTRSTLITKQSRSSRMATVLLAGCGVRNCCAPIFALWSGSSGPLLALLLAQALLRRG
jgi:hypothetical protein